MPAPKDPIKYTEWIKNRKGKHFSSLTEFKKGQSAWNKKDKISLLCAYCSSPFKKLESSLGRGRGKYCSKECFYKGRPPNPNFTTRGKHIWKDKIHPLSGKKSWNTGLKGVQVAWNKDKPWSEEVKQKLKKSHIGLKPSYETRINMKKGQAKRFENHIYLTSESKLIRGSIENRLWRESIFTRDKFLCQMPNCDKLGRYLEAHHIKTFSKYPELRFITENGITLCKRCHNKTKRKEVQFENLFAEILKINDMLK